jgi:hypothetical protein
MLNLRPMSELNDSIKDEDIFIFEPIFTDGKASVVRMVINDRWCMKACGWCYRNEYV